MARKATKHDPSEEGLPTSTTPLLGGTDAGLSPSRHRRRTYVKGIAIGAFGLAFAAIAIIGLFTNGRHDDDADRQPLCKQWINATLLARAPVSRGKPDGVSEKSNHGLLGNGIGFGFGPSYPWTNNMLSFQRTGFHFQPEKNWMNDPNGPMYYNGYYHFFYQYNPGGAIWGSPIVWGHAVSEDFIHWTHLPIALAADQWYDVNGVWSGSTTILPDGQIILLYTGSSNESAQQQNLAYPKNLSDPLLVEWVKYPGNPILTAPKGIDKKDFRDPTTAWLTSEGKWRITIGSKVNRTGVAFVYETEDFKTYKLLPSVLHAVPKTGMWECVDFYPVSLTSNNGLDPSTNGPEVKHVMKVSLDDDRHDYYSIGTYNESANTWKPDNPEIDVGIGIRYDYGIFYASKTFYDQKKQRRILWGWISESDSESADVMKGWASIQGVPRTLVLDKKTGYHLLQWPVEETEGLRFGGKKFNNIQVEAGKVIPLVVESASQIDIVAEFDIDKVAVEMASGSDEEFSCAKSSGSAQRGSLGPFGILVLTDQNQMEQTPVYFYVFKTSNGTLKTSFCTDQSRSSIASDVSKEIYGTYVPVLDGEKLSVRILVDHSIVESFAQGGRSVITSRVYPTRAIYGNAQVFVFNNATDAGVMASVKIWQMNSTAIHQNDKNDILDDGPCIE